MHLHKFFHMWSHISHVITNIWSHVCDVCDFFLQWISVQTWSMVLCGFHLNLSFHNYLNRHSILSFFCTYYPRRHILPGCRPRLSELERGNLFSSMCQWIWIAGTLCSLSLNRCVYNLGWCGCQGRFNPENCEFRGEHREER